MNTILMISVGAVLTYCLISIFFLLAIVRNHKIAIELLIQELRQHEKETEK